MRHIFLFLLLFGLAYGGRAQDSAADLAQQANVLYEQGDYAAALGIYETLSMAGVYDSALYYNMGQIYLAMQDSGRALLQFRRAQQAAPRDVELNLALAQTRAGRIDIQGDDAALMDGLAALTIPLVSLDELNWLAFGLWTLCFGLGAIYAVRPGWRPAVRLLLVITGVLLLMGLVLWCSRVYTSTFRPAAVVTAAAAPVMSGPGEDYLEIYQLHAAAEIRILEQRGDWTHFVLPNGREGWIQNGAFEKV